MGSAGGMPGAAGDAPRRGEGGDGGAPDALTCIAGFADCDDSRFTGCETELSWTQRHCGACGNVCAGACAFGKCVAADVLARDLIASSLVSTKTHAFATLKSSGAFVGRFDLQTGALQSLLEGISSDTIVTLARDRVYAFDPDGETLHGIPFGATELAAPEPLLRPASFGSNQRGTYYVRYADSDSEDESDELWYRQQATDDWQHSTTATSLDILSSSAYGVVLEQELGDGTWHLSTLNDGEQVDHGPTPPGLYQAVAVMGGIVAIGTEPDAAGWELYWLTPDGEVTHYPLEDSLVEYGQSLLPFDKQAAVLLEDRNRTYLQFFDRRGRRPLRLGLASYSIVAALDEQSLWHTTYDSPITLRVLRSTWQSLNDF